MSGVYEEYIEEIRRKTLEKWKERIDRGAIPFGKLEKMKELLEEALELANSLHYEEFPAVAILYIRSGIREALLNLTRNLEALYKLKGKNSLLK